MRKPTCPRCGGPLRTDVLAGVCPACLLRSAITHPGLVPGAVDRIGDYRLLELIGEGGMGQVFLCEQEAPIRRRAALKIIKHGMDTQEVIARFEAERQALALMEHPNIARVLDAGTAADGRPFFAMEYVPGIPLTEYCDRHRLATDARLRLFLQVCDAVQHAHHKGVIHRDLKPSNVLVMVLEDRPVPKVIDFGIAKALHGRITERTLFTQHGILVGTPEYMSPEQAASDAMDVDTRTDIYSLGVLLYELLVGMLPFDAARIRAAAYVEMQRIIREDDPPRPSVRLTGLGQDAVAIAARRHTDVPSLEKALRGDLDWVTLKAMEKDRTRRYPSASELSADILHHLENEPVNARPPSAAYRMRKFTRRHRALVASMAAIALAVSSAAVLSTLFYLRAERTGRQARTALVEAYASEGMRIVDRGDHLTALPWLVKALELEDSRADRQDAHRIRIGTVLRHAPPLIRLWSHEREIYSARFSPDGRLVATASADGTARIWDVATGTPVTDSLRHDGEVMAAEFSSDGRRLVTASTDGSARIWDVRTGAAGVGPLRHGAAIYRAVFSADDTYVATASADGTARVWSAASGHLVMTVPHDGDVTQVSFSQDAREIITASVDGTAIRWRVPEGTGIGFPLRHELGVAAAVFSPDDRRILTSGGDGVIRLWDRTTHRVLTQVSHDRGQFAMFSGDGARVVTAGNDNTARIWLTDALPSTPPVVLRHDHGVTDITVQPAGPLIATGSADGKVHVWSSITGRPIGTTLQHVGAVRSVRFDATGRYLLTAGRDGTARVWDLATREDTRIISSSCADATMIRFSEDGQRIAGAGLCARLWDERTGDALTPPIGRLGSRQFSRDLSRIIGLEPDGARVWNLANAQPIGRLLPAESVTVVAISPDGDVALTGSGSQTWFGLLPGQRSTVAARRPTTAGDAQLWNVDTGSPIGQRMPHDETVVVAAFSPNGRRIATVTATGAVRVWDSPTGQPLTAELRISVAPRLVKVAFSADSELMATGADDGSIQLWNAATGRLISTFTQHTSIIRALAFSKDGDQLLSASFDGTVRLWDLRRGEQHGPPLQHNSNLSSATFSPDGRWILTGSADSTSRVWDARTGIPVTPAYPHQMRVADVAFAPDGRRFATASSDIRSRPFLPDDRPFERLESMARLLGGFHVEGMVAVPLSGAELVREWHRYGAAAATAPSR